MVYQDATGLYHFVINVIPFISNSVYLHLVMQCTTDLYSIEIVDPCHVLVYHIIVYSITVPYGTIIQYM